MRAADEPVRGISVCVFTDRRENVRVGVDPAPVASEKVRAVDGIRAIPGSDGGRSGAGAQPGGNCLRRFVPTAA